MAFREHLHGFTSARRGRATLSSLLLATAAACGGDDTANGGASVSDAGGSTSAAGTDDGSAGTPSGGAPESDGGAAGGTTDAASAGATGTSASATTDGAGGDSTGDGGDPPLGCGPDDLPPLPPLYDEFVPPKSAGFFNVREAPFFAKGDGIADDTLAIQNALCGKNEGQPNGGGSIDRVVYFPAGTYLVRDTLDWCTGYKRYTTLQGQSRDGVILRLAPGSPGFGDPEHPAPVLSMVGDVPGQKIDGMAWSFRNTILDLTIEIGEDNPGAIGVSYLASNQGTLRNVTLRAADGSGAIGLDLRTPVQGPALIRHVDIRGFDVGVDVARIGSMVFEDLWLAGQRTAGIRSDGLRMAIHRLRSRNCVPAFVDAEDSAFTVLVDAELDGDAPDVPAIETRGFLYARDVATAGYAAALRVRDELPLGDLGKIDEFATIPLRQAFTADVTYASLKLPIEPTPEVPWGPIDAWADVREFGAKSNVSGYNQPAKPGDDATAAIQAALDSGAPAVFLPNGIYTVRDTLRVRGDVVRIHGMDSVLKVAPPLSTSGKPVFRIEDGAAARVVIERIDTDFANDGSDCVFVEHATPRPVVLRNLSINRCRAYAAADAAAGGALFVEDITGSDWRLGAQQAWFRQFNPEGGKSSAPDAPIGEAMRKISVQGGTAWIFGMKTEGTGLIAEALGGASVELLGSLTQATTYVPATHPAIHNVDSDVSVVASENDDPYALYPTIVREVRDGLARTLINYDLPARFSGALFLYASAGAPVPGWQPPPRDGFAMIEVEGWDACNNNGKWSVCRGGAPDLSQYGLPGPRGALSCFYGFNWARYERVSLPKPATAVTIRYSSSRLDKPAVELRLGDANGPLLASLTVEDTGKYEDPRVPGRYYGKPVEVTLPVALPEGTHALVLVAVASPQSGNVADIDWIRFTP